MESFNHFILVLHALSGTAALVLGALAMATRKGGKAHIGTGNGYFWSMNSVAATALWLSAYKANWFLLVIGLFSFYGNLGGKLILSKAPQAQAQRRWQRLSLLGLLIGSSMLGVSYYLYQSNSQSAIILLVFGVVQTLLALKDWRYSQTFDPKQHILQHITKMGATYIATFTAFLVVNIQFLPPLLVWLSPTVVGTLAIVIAKRKWQQKLRITP